MSFTLASLSSFGAPSGPQTSPVDPGADAVWLKFADSANNPVLTGVIAASGAGKTFTELGLTPAEMGGARSVKLLLVAGDAVKVTPSDGGAPIDLAPGDRITLEANAVPEFAQRITFTGPFVRVDLLLMMYPSGPCGINTCPHWVNDLATAIS